MQNMGKVSTEKRLSTTDCKNYLLHVQLQ